MKNVFEDVRIFVAADPAQGIKLKRSMGRRRKKKCEFEGANVERDADIPQLLLQHGSHEPSALLGRRLHGEMKTNAIHLRIARLLQQLPGARRIVIIGRHVAVIGPTFRRQNAVRRPAKSAQ